MQSREKGETSDCKEEQKILRRSTTRLIHTSSAKVSKHTYKLIDKIITLPLQKETLPQIKINSEHPTISYAARFCNLICKLSVMHYIDEITTKQNIYSHIMRCSRWKNAQWISSSNITKQECKNCTFQIVQILHIIIAIILYMYINT